MFTGKNPKPAVHSLSVAVTWGNLVESLELHDL